MLKVCSICNKEFDGYRSSKLCSDECRVEKELQRSRSRAKTKEFKKKQLQYREAHRTELSARQRAYHKANKETINAAKRQQYAQDPEPAKRQAKAWAKTNKKRVAKNNKAWVKANPDRVRASQHKHRSAVQGNGGSYTAAEWKTLCKQYNYKCLDCGKRRKLTADHVVPVSKGGTSNIDNIQPLCSPCNSRKGAKCTDFRRT